MEKLTDKINAFKVSHTLKLEIMRISEVEGLYINQIIKRLIEKGLADYQAKELLDLH